MTPPKPEGSRLMTDNRDLVGAAAEAGSGVETEGEALEKVEERKLPPPDGGGPEPQCGYCAARFWTRESLAEHVYQAHSGPRPPPTAEALAAKDREIERLSFELRAAQNTIEIDEEVIARKITANARLTSQVERLMEVVDAARDLVMKPGGLVNRGVNVGLVVVEKADKSDPHYRLCTAFERLDSIKEGLGEAAADAGLSGVTEVEAER